MSNRISGVSTLTQAVSDWFLAYVTGVLPAAPPGTTTSPGTDPSGQYTYTFYEFELHADGSYEPRENGRIGTSSNPGVSITGALLQAGSIVLARAAGGVSGHEWELFGVPQITPGGTGTTSDTPDQIDPGQYPALDQFGNLVPTQLMQTDYPVGSAKATQLQLTPPGPISPDNPLWQLQIATNGDGNGNLQITQAVYDKLSTTPQSPATGWNRITTFQGQTGQVKSIVDQFMLPSTSGGPQVVATQSYSVSGSGMQVTGVNLTQAGSLSAALTAAAISAATGLIAANNLSDVASKVTALTNLGAQSLTGVLALAGFSSITGTLPAANLPAGVVQWSEVSTAAAGNSQGTAATLTNFAANFVTGANGTNGVVVPNVAGYLMAYNSDPSNTVLLYPPSGAHFNQSGTNVATNLASHNTVVIYRISSTQFLQIAGSPVN